MRSREKDLSSAATWNESLQDHFPSWEGLKIIVSQCLKWPAVFWVNSPPSGTRKKSRPRLQSQLTSMPPEERKAGCFFTVEMRWSRMTFRFFWGVENIKHSSFLVAMFHSRCKTSGWSFHFLKNRSMIHLGQLPDFPKWVTFLVFFHCPIRFGRQKPCFILA